MEKFKKQVIEYIDSVISGISTDPLFLTIRPLVKLGLKYLSREIDENPETIYLWLGEAEKRIKRARKVYEDEVRKQP